MSEAFEPRNIMRGPIPYTMAHASAEVAVIEVEQIPQNELDRPSLGELNPLIHEPILGRKEVVSALQMISSEKIAKYGGVVPDQLGVEHVVSMKQGGAAELRFIARFEISPDQFDANKMSLLETQVKNTYGKKVRTSKTDNGKDAPVEGYPFVNASSATRSIRRGWYIGPDQSATDTLHEGLFVFKDLGEVNRDNFFENADAVNKFIIEIREASLYQTDLVEFVTQVSTILGKGEALDHGDLLYEIYYDLYRLGLRDTDERRICGMEEPLARIDRGLLIPLASPELSQGIDQQAESVMLIGHPGTGKTLIVEEELKRDTGVFIVPLDPIQLSRELREDKKEQKVLARIAQVAKSTGKSVVLHIDDIENMLHDNDITHSTMLNLMRGIRETGFHIIASTNEPERIGEALLQPQRFGIIIYCGLPDEEARREILKLHASMESDDLDIPLFPSEEAREGIIEVIAAKTENFTPRYVAEIANVAKSFLLERIAHEKGKKVGLTEEDLNGYHLTPEDWEAAYYQVASNYDCEEVEKRDKFLREFVHKHSVKPKIGLSTPSRNGRENGRLFPQEVYDVYARNEVLE